VTDFLHVVPWSIPVLALFDGVSHIQGAWEEVIRKPHLLYLGGEESLLVNTESNSTQVSSGNFSR
jgi:hypothetical protein